jgi:hypothetical protein
MQACTIGRPVHNHEVTLCSAPDFIAHVLDGSVDGRALDTAFHITINVLAFELVLIGSKTCGHGDSQLQCLSCICLSSTNLPFPLLPFLYPPLKHLHRFAVSSRETAFLFFAFILI